MSRLQPGENGAIESDQVDGVLGALRRQVVALSQELPANPGSIRVAAGDLVVEVGWSTAAPTAVTEPARTPPSAAPGPVVRSSVVPASALPPSTVSVPVAPAVAAESAPPPGAVPGGLLYLTAHTVGVFYTSPEPGTPPFVQPGDLVEPGQQVGIVEAMKLMIPIESPSAGRIVEVLVTSGTAVEYGERLFVIDSTVGAVREAA
jgi:acetyl-CoA carboxylase biotin carboxyl carrier protein